jgi:hypothetical protein
MTVFEKIYWTSWIVSILLWFNCHAMNCICKLKLKEHTSDIYRMWEDKCDKWEMRVN